MKNLKKHFEENYQLLLTNSQLVEIARAALEDCKPEIIGQHITEPELTVEDLVKGEWYHMKTEVGDFLLKFERIISSNNIKTFKHLIYNPAKHFSINEPFNVVVNQDMFYHKKYGDKLRHATREEIVKYFPHEFEIDSHGGNDHIQEVTDPQI